ncbi:MBL fold metallo-hydrolase [Limibacillus halophilus]|uniref:Glyoxylase-like metal-dependent hydrolase (Beta-lactamase superfamily II) n=1 Tax=Limibacillus halophilus TaxID=1579333 RepID=A0A839SSK0_9PROT|nr:MBL fold metallo-hydrolase [Limibacillus halophilus]MBB3065442.1 glyoxylase-like metal-dependent hydrolase (beta-lactamase superfamily II) [Limibacillus halophilus]
MKTDVKAFFDNATNTVSYIASDPETKKAIVIDPLLDFDPASCRTSHESADKIIAHINQQALSVSLILETHVHADHLSAGQYLKERLGAPVGIGFNIKAVQAAFAEVFNLGPEVAKDGSQFDRLFQDDESFQLGTLPAKALHVPGHTPSCMAYLIGDAIFVGDTLFMPDFGTARCDFPGGDAGLLYRSIQRILALPAQTRIFVGHDYKAPGRDVFAWETTVAKQREGNVHLRDGVTEQDFVRTRTERDANLAVPRLLLPAVQVNMRAGALPDPESNGISYLKLPANTF